MKANLSRMDQLKLRHLRFLLLLAHEQHLGRAAEQLALTQPAASRMLSELESRFGVALFDRGRHGMRPTAAAAPVLQFAALVCTEEQLLQASLSGSGSKASPVRVGTLPSTPAIVVQALERCKANRPAGDIVLQLGTLNTLLPTLHSGELDLVVGRFDPQLAQAPFDYTRLVDEPLFIVAGTGHPLLARRSIKSQQLREQPWVAPVRGSSLFPHFASLFGGLPLPDDTVECASPLVLISLLRDDRRLGLISGSLLSQPWCQGVARVRYKLPSTPGSLGLYTVSGRWLKAEARAFCDELTHLSRQLRPG